ncbi:MAG: hypothetical protein P8M22_09535 [Phycisphaerales bacterium]|nr:hypothetical protein [Phycisphaerales bacterium]
MTIRHALAASYRHAGLQAIMISLLFIAGCASTTRKPSLPVVLVDQASNGAEVKLAPNQEMIIQLIVNIRDDISWVMVGTIEETILQPLGQRLFQARDSQDRPLTRPLEEIKFRAVGNGEVIIDLAYVPQGGTLAQSSNRFFLRVIVDEFATSR